MTLKKAFDLFFNEVLIKINRTKEISSEPKLLHLSKKVQHKQLTLIQKRQQSNVHSAGALRQRNCKSRLVSRGHSITNFKNSLEWKSYPLYATWLSSKNNSVVKSMNKKGKSGGRGIISHFVERKSKITVKENATQFSLENSSLSYSGLREGIQWKKRRLVFVTSLIMSDRLVCQHKMWNSKHFKAYKQHINGCCKQSFILRELGV